jgi:N-glycosidase YbiA
MNKEISTKEGEEISLNGYSLKTLKNALQKYIKKSNSDKAIYTGIELDVFQCLEGGEKIFNEFIQLLKIIYLENLGISAIGIWSDLDDMFQKISQTNNKAEKTKTVLNIIYTLSLNKHSNISKHFYQIFEMFENFQEYLDYFPTVKKIYQNIEDKSRHKNLEDVKFLENTYYESLKNRDIDSFYWATLIDKHNKLKREQKEKIIFDTYKKVLEETDKIDRITPVSKKWYLEFFNTEYRYLTYYIPILFWTLEQGYLGKIFELDNWEKYVYKNVLKPALKFDKFVYIENIKEDSELKDEFLINEIKDFFLFSKLLEEDILDDSYLKTYVDYSNFFPLTNYSMYSIKIGDEEFKSVEHYYQAMKFLKDKKTYQKVKESKSSLDAKKLGEDYSYDNKKLEEEVIEKALKSKFSQHSELKKLLKETKGDIIYKILDSFLGIGYDNQGKNIVGKILKKIRDEKPETIYYFESKPNEIKKSKSFVAFDIDGTIVSPSNVLLYNVKNKFNQLYKSGKNIVLISNQKRRKIGDPKLKEKLEKIASQLDIPFIAFCAREEDEYRKPNSGIINLIPESYGKIELYVGDAAGRKGDHSDDDLKFAENVGVKFMVPEDYFKK